jgi:hypothetical protein
MVLLLVILLDSPDGKVKMMTSVESLLAGGRSSSGCGCILRYATTDAEHEEDMIS